MDISCFIFCTLEKTEGSEVKESSVALKLGLRKPPDIKVEEFYPTFLNMTKNFMEGEPFQNCMLKSVIKTKPF